MYLSRVRIADRPAVAALRALIDPVPGPVGRLHDPERGRIMDAHHRLVWSLFAGPDETRDFLWRAEGGGRFLILSRRPPAADGAGLFDPPEVRVFAPDLRAGDRLAFVLRANATRSRKGADPRARGTRVDVVMDAIHALPSGRVSDERRDARMAAAQDAGRAWLEGQGARFGFAVEEFDAADYSVLPLPDHPRPRRNQPQFGVIEMTGTLSLTDPATFLAQVENGFGRARAFGCGLMLIRRA